MKKSQLSLEYLIIFVTLLLAIIAVLAFSETIITEQEIDYSAHSIVSQISDAAETVTLMGYPARQTFNVYVPKNVNPDGTYIRNNTVNYGIFTPQGTSDIFDITNFCVKGNLPYYEGYYVINVVAIEDCTLIDYKDFYVYPSNIVRTFPEGTSVDVTIDIINLLLNPVDIIITANSSTAPITDVNPHTVGRQVVYDFGEQGSGVLNSTILTFFGDAEGLFNGYIYVNNLVIPVNLTITESAVIPPTVTNTQVNATSVNVNDYVCFNASVIQGTNPIDEVWAQVTSPSSAANYTLIDTGCSCCGIGADNVYGADFQLTSAGIWTINTTYANDTSNYIAFESPFPNIDIMVSSSALINTTVFFEDFNPQPYYNYNWSRQGTDWDSKNNANCYSSGGCAHADGTCDESNDWIITDSGLIDLSGANNVYVDLYVREDTSFDAGEYFRVWCYDSSSWINIYEEDAGDWTSTGTYHHREFLADNNCFISDSRFKITIMSDKNNEDVFVDDFRVIKEE